jgi:hypothetical protein
MFNVRIRNNIYKKILLSNNRALKSLTKHKPLKSMRRNRKKLKPNCYKRRRNKKISHGGRSKMS